MAMEIVDLHMMFFSHSCLYVYHRVTPMLVPLFLDSPPYSPYQTYLLDLPLAKYGASPPGSTWRVFSPQATRWLRQGLCGVRRVAQTGEGAGGQLEPGAF